MLEATKQRAFALKLITETLANNHEFREGNMNMVRAFHILFGQAAPTAPTHMTEYTSRLRSSLVHEEHKEFQDHLTEYLAAIAQGNKAVADVIFVGLVDDCCDIIYVVLGTLVSMGVDFGKVFLEVGLSNMSKAGEDGKAIKRDDGKVLKGPNFFKPELGKLVGTIKSNG